MLACLQRQNHQQQQQLSCAATPHHKSELNSTRYPSASELDAYAQRTADNPLSIKIFPTNIRVPQHKQISRTINGLDARFGSYSHQCSGAYQGLLAIVKTPAVIKGVLKSSDGKRTKLSPIQMAVAPYALPSSRHQQKSYLSHGIVQQMTRPSNIQTSPSFLASCADSGFAVAQSGLAYSGAVLPTQSADVAGSDYWQRHPQGLLNGTAVSRSPEACYRSHSLSAGAMLDKRVSSSPAVHGQFFAPAWNSVLATPDSDCYNPPALPAGSSMCLGPHPYPSGLCFPQGKNLCQASLLSSSLQSLECLISEIHPPCIKECMLGRGYEAIPQLLDPPHAPLQLLR